MSLRWRIALGLALIAALVCAIGATGAYLTTSHQLYNSIDDSLLARAQSFDGQGNPNPGADPDPDFASGRIRLRGCPPPGPVQPASAAQVVGVDGTVHVCIAG